MAKKDLRVLYPVGDLAYCVEVLNKMRSDKNQVAGVKVLHAFVISGVNPTVTDARTWRRFNNVPSNIFSDVFGLREDVKGVNNIMRVKS